MRYLVGLVVVVGLVLGGAWVVAGHMSGPVVTIHAPERFVGQTTALDLTAEAPRGTLDRFEIVLEQQGRRVPLATSIDAPGLEIKQEGENRIRIRRQIGKRQVPELQSGPARIVVTASRPVMYGLRSIEGTATRDLQVRLEPPRISGASLHHFVNHGGAEFVVYRATPADVASGVRVGEVEYPGFPASGAGALAGVQLGDPLKVAFFALLHDQDLNTPISLFARDPAGNTARGDFDYRQFARPFRRSRIELDDRFINRVVPAILERTPDFQPRGSIIEQFVAINSELRRRNAAQIASFAAKTASEALFSGPFQQLAKSQVESVFADQRTYFYKGKEVDRQVHLGFDLATTANAPIVASNRGTVLFADYLGIYGNTVILDHGLGVQSLYAHLSSFDISVGDTVEKGAVIGRSGMTGLAGGDHLHFTMLINGHMVSPVEFWDGHWLEDRVLRKLREAAAAP